MKRRLRASLFALRRLGLLGWVGAALAAASLAYGAVLVAHRQAELDDLNADVARVRQRHAALEARRRASGAATPAKAVAELPTVKTTADALLNLETVARNFKLQISRSDYRYVERTRPASAKPGSPAPVQDPVVEVQIAMPSSGKYHDIRPFIAKAMESLPTLALDGMSLKRESIAQSGVEAQLRFTLFVRGER